MKTDVTAAINLGDIATIRGHVRKFIFSCGFSLCPMLVSIHAAGDKAASNAVSSLAKNQLYSLAVTAISLGRQLPNVSAFSPYVRSP